MRAIRRIQKAKNGKVIVDLPAEFEGQEVEVIVSPVHPSTRFTEAGMAIQRFLETDTSGFNEKQLAAYRRACDRIRQGRSADEPRILGLTGGLVELADDFNDPLPDEHLFYGEEAEESKTETSE